MQCICWSVADGTRLTCRVFCPREIVSNWFLYHFPCAKSTHEKLALIDAYQGMHNLHRFETRLPVSTSRRHD